MRRLRKLMSLTLTGVLLAGALAGCGQKDSGSADSDVIKIGGIAPLTGNVAVYGVAASNGAKLAIEEINASGGILGKQIEYIEYDDKGDTTEAVNAYKKLVNNNKVNAIIGAVTSKPTLAITPLAAKEGIPMITPTATALDVTAAGTNIFRTCFIDPYQGEIMAKFALENLNASKAAVLYNTADDYSLGVAEAFKNYFEANGGTVVSYEGYGADEKDYKAILTNVKTQNPDVLFLPDYYNTVGLIAQQVKEVGINATLLGADGWDGVLTVAPEAVEGGYFCNHYSTDDTAEEVQNFIKKYKETYNEDPVSFAALGYDTVKILAAAIEKAGTTDYDAVVKALAETNITSVTGTITYDENRNPVKDVAIIKIENGQNRLYTKVNPQ